MSRSTIYSAASDAQPEINEQQVLDYLKASPDFFRQHPEAIANLTLPHNSGGATSLVERQVAVLRERGIQTRRKLSELVDIAKDNDQIFERTQSLVLTMLKSQDIDSLCDEVIKQFGARFGVEKTAIIYSESQAADDAKSSLQESRFSKPAALAEQRIGHLIDTQIDAQHTFCGILREPEAEFIFDTSVSIGSVAVASRRINDSVTLLLAVANSDSNHYNQETGTLFIDYLADILALRSKQII